MPERKLSFHDIIRGRVELNLGLMGDIIIAKDATHPLYNFAAVVDDAEMQITHVIRGEDHLANTPKQIAIFEALGLEIPHYAHLPLILGSDRSKLSKRHGAMSLNEYQTQGYLPEAMVNFLALLGWNPDTNEEIFSKDDLIEKFSLEKVQKAGAVFNLKKLVWLNSVYLRRLSGEVILEKVAPFWKKLHINFLSFKPEILIKILELQKERAKTLNELAESCRFFFEILEYDASLLIWKNISPLDTKANLEALIKLLSEIREEAFNKINLEQASADLRDKRGNGEIYWPWRVALSGLAGSPGPLDISEILGKTETLRRLQYAISKL
jgi:glutamyl-tRNA synthetase